ncbi:MAG: hypothetical protein IT331_13585 [Anaerolineae bacterium]|nr:hypothetical protein [Anaerolineae bacterium]
MERLTLPVGLSFPKTAFEVSIEFDDHLKNARAKELLPIPTGFAELDEILGGGLHPEALMFVGGPPGVGKTIFVMQAARNIAASGKANACVVCFEHSEVYLYQRLLCMESALNGSILEAITLDDIREVMGQDNSNLEVLLNRSASARQAWSRFTEYWERLYLIKGHPIKTTLNVLDLYLTDLKTRVERVVLFVDYLQKVPVPFMGVELSAEKQIRIVTEGLKNLAMAHHVPIVAVAASDAEGLKSSQVRFQDLWGGASVQYEPDVAVMLNRGSEKRVEMSVEKNRVGPTGTVELELLGRSFTFRILSDEH